MSDYCEWDYIQNRYKKENKWAEVKKKADMETAHEDSYAFRDRNWLFERFNQTLDFIKMIADQHCKCSSPESVCTVCKARSIIEEILNEKPLS